MVVKCLLLRIRLGPFLLIASTKMCNTVVVRSIGTVSGQHRVSCPTKSLFCRCQQGGVPKFRTCQRFTFILAAYRHCVLLQKTCYLLFRNMAQRSSTNYNSDLLLLTLLPTLFPALYSTARIYFRYSIYQRN